MRYKPLGSSGILVSELGFGTWGIGGSSEAIPSYGTTDDNESRRALEEALDQGINFFDTATAYGRSEELLGQTFGGSKRSRVVIATKVGISKFFTPQDFSKNAIIECLENSLKRLKTDYVDLIQLFNPPLEKLPVEDMLETLNKLKEKGSVRAIGISVKSPAEGIIALKYKDIVALQTNLNMIDQRAIDSGLLRSAEQQNVGIIARTPLCFGFLTGQITDLNFGPSDHRSKWPLEQLKMWHNASRLLSEILPDPNWSLTYLALRFCMDSEGVTTVIPGPLITKEVADNVSATKLPPLGPEIISMIRKIYDDNNQFSICK
mgnify:CR=1 FL=1